MKLISGRRFTFLIVFVSILIFTLSLSLFASTLEVARDDSGINSIQEAVTRAKPGDTLLIKSGEYEENVSIDKDLTIKALELGNVRVDGTKKGLPAMRVGPSKATVEVIGVILEGAEGELCDDRTKGLCPSGLSAAGKSSVRAVSSTFDSNGRDGLRLVGSARVELDDSEITGNGHAGLWVSDSAEATIENTRVANNRNGVSLSRSGSVEVRGSDITSSSGYGFKLFGKSRITLENSLVADNGKGGLRIENSSMANLVDNSIMENEGRALLIQGSAKVNMTGTEVKNNPVGVTSHTDKVVSFSENEISGNAVDLVGDLSGDMREKLSPEKTDGITLPNEDYPNLQEAVDALKQGGTIYLDGEVTGNAVIDKKMSIEVKEDLAQLTSRGDTGAPVLSLIKNAEVALGGLRIADSGGSGVVLGGNARLSTSKSSFEDNSEEGIGLWDSAELQLERSAVKKNGGSGLRLVDSAQLEVRASQISGNQVANVLLAGSSSGYVNSSKVTASEGNGFSLNDSARLSVRGSEISGNDSNGLKFVATAHGSLADCDLTDNDGDGVALYSSSQVDIDGSNITKNVNGISLRDSSVLVTEKNSFRKNGNGIKVVEPEEFRGEIRGTENAFSENDSDFAGVEESVKDKLTE